MGDLLDTPGRPELLVGTFNKMHPYTASVFADLHCHFHKCLRQVNSLICCGYGFGDKGINTKLAEWINTDQSPFMPLVYAQSLMPTHRFAVRFSLSGVRTFFFLKIRLCSLS